MLESLKNYRRYDKHLHTSAQPDAEQLSMLGVAGIEVVINLARADSPGAIAEESRLIEQQGIGYINIPVDFKAPTRSDFDKFARVMSKYHQRPMLVHCAYNWRVSCFVFLYRVLYQHLDTHVARNDMLQVWQPDETWQAFLDDCLQRPPAGTQ